MELNHREPPPRLTGPTAMGAFPSLEFLAACSQADWIPVSIKRLDEGRQGGVAAPE